LNEIYQINPLLFDFVTKRCVKSPVEKKKFSPSIFGWNNALLPPIDKFPPLEIPIELKLNINLEQEKGKEKLQVVEE